MKACEEARAKSQELRIKLDALIEAAPAADAVAAEEALSQARTALARDTPAGDAWPCAADELERPLKLRQADLNRHEKMLHEARGELNTVGGSAVREQRDRQAEDLELLKRNVEDLELECKAVKRLHDIMKEVEETHAAHLGRTLAQPVAERFSELTARRYSQMMIDSELRPQTVNAAGAPRPCSELSVGTRDQLATLIRLAIASRLRTTLLLDDQLTQTDPNRLLWFRDLLRTSVKQHAHQIIVITCRPLDYMLPEELPTAPAHWRLQEDLSLLVADLGALAECH